MAERLASLRQPDRHAPPDARFVNALAQAEGIKQALQWLSRERRWIDEQHLLLCRIAAPTFFEQKRAEWVAQQFREYGYEAKLDRAGNMVAHAPGLPVATPLVAITAHLDTVLAPRTPEEIGLRADGYLHGPGVADNGAGLAALLAVGKALSAIPASLDRQAQPLFVANVGEEGEGNLSGMRYLCRQSPLAERIKAFLVLDGPTTDHITCQALASRRFEVTLTGAGGHSWSDYGVGNPSHALARVVALFAEYLSGEKRDRPPRTSFNFGVLEGGSSVNSIPTLARAKLDLRSESAPRLDELAQLLTTCVERALELENEHATASRVTAKIKEIGSRPGGGLPAQSPLLAYLRAVEAHLGIRSRLDCASTDANVPLSLGLPAVSIGAGGQGGGAHTPNEWYNPEGREQGLRRILLTLALLLRDPEVG